MPRLLHDASTRLVCAFALWLALLPSRAPAFDIWDGGGSDDNWTTGANWLGFMSPGAPPANDGTADIVMPAMGGLVQTPIVDVPYSINSLQFGNGNGRFVILAVAELTIGAGGVTNNDTDLQSVIGSLKLSANQTWTNNAGLLQMDTVNLNGFDLTVAGSFPTDLISVITGTGNLHLPVGYSSTVTLLSGGNNTYVGLTDVQGGTLRLQKTGGGVAVPGDLTIGNGATVLLAGNEQISQAAGNEVAVNAGGLLDVNTRTETLAKLTLNGGAASTTGAGKLVAAEALVTGNTASWTNSNNLYVGDTANGTLDVTAGGDVTCGFCYFGNQSGVTGDVDIDGTGSTLNAGSGLHVGYNGTGTVSVTSGGQLTTAGTLTGTRVGSLPGSTGQVTVDGAGSVWNVINNSFLSIGAEGNGTLDVTNDGQVNSLGADIGSLGTSTGMVAVDDAGWTVSGALFVGYLGEGSLSITGGGEVLLDVFDRHAYLGYETGSTGTATVDGTGSTWSLTSDIGMQDAYVGYSGDGTLMITNGGHVTNRVGLVGYNPMAEGMVTVDGADSTWTNTGEFLFIGDQGTGTLHVTNGATVTSDIAHIGDTGSGTVLVDGSGSTWSSNREILVGNFGVGAVTVSNGGRIQSSDGIVGARDGSDGSVTVDGVGSIWENADDFSVDSGSLTISSGGSVTNMVGNIGTLATETGMVMVDGAGSTWVNASELYVGINNVGMLDVTGGGEVSSANGYLGFNPGSSGAVTVDGAGSRWTSAGDVSIGYFGNGVLTVSNGGTLEATNVYVGVNAPGELHGDGTIVANVQNDGLVSSGASPGALNIDGDYTQTSDGELLIDIASSAFDQLLVTGTATLAGTLQVSLLDGYVPAISQTFTILTANNVDDQFDVEPPSPIPGLAFDVIYNAQSVVLEVIEAPLPGDFDLDRDVDGPDFLKWQRGESPTPFSAADLADWEANYGIDYPLLAAAAPVPEPSTAVLGLLTMALGGLHVARRRAPGADPGAGRRVSG